MDWSKYPLEKLFSLVAAIIPGFTALLISRNTVYRLLSLESLGYRTKLTVLIVISFVVGFTMTTFLQAVLGAIGGALGAATYETPYSLAIAPWRDPRWRELVRAKLGASCPNDTRPLSTAIFNLRTELINNLPPGRRPQETFNLQEERLRAESDDLAWATWYDHYHKIIVTPDDKDIFLHVHTGLRFSLETAAVYCLGSAAIVPAVRHWWCLVPAGIWVLILAVESVESARKSLNRWSTLNDQIKYLAIN
jgi:hypothetical protein